MTKYNIWFFGSLIVAAVVAMPIITVFFSFFNETSNYFYILKETFLLDYIFDQGFSLFGDGFGHSNIIFSYAADEATKKEIDNQIIYRNPGQVVSFNNLYANILMSTGLIGLMWFLYIIIDTLRKLVLHNSKLQPFILTSIISTLFMFSYQAEELSSHLAIAIAFSLNLSKNEE